MVESFWSIPATGALRTPLTILREQATALTEQTKGTLVGEATVLSQPSQMLSIGLSIRVLALNDDKYRILTYEQPVTMYPGSLTSNLGDGMIRIVKSEDEFVKELKRLLSSQEAQRLLTSLLVQASDAEPLAAQA
ncbi:MAG TPA: hypothetical protein VMB34_07200 [Acetobacteraceae bacterium]|nr:hypothetical protein [Acetobacteraceae bacterium]